jgi:hypothetical protein
MEMHRARPPYAGTTQVPGVGGGYSYILYLYITFLRACSQGFTVGEWFVVGLDWYMSALVKSRKQMYLAVPVEVV